MTTLSSPIKKQNKGISITIEESGSVTELITLEEAKNYIRVDDDIDDDLIMSLIIGARQWCEEYTQRSFILKTITADFVEIGDYNTLPYGPITGIDSLTGLNSEVVFEDGTDYKLVGKDKFLMLRRICEPVQLIYSAEWVEVPEPIVIAMLRWINTIYDNREDYVQGVNLKEAPLDLKMLLRPYVNQFWF